MSKCMESDLTLIRVKNPWLL